MASLLNRLMVALGDAPGVTAGDLLLCREAVLSGQAAKDRDVILEVRGADRFIDGPAIQAVTADWIRQEGAFCALHAGCSLGAPGEPRALSEAEELAILLRAAGWRARQAAADTACDG